MARAETAPPAICVAGLRHRKITPRTNNAANPATRMYSTLLLMRGGSAVTFAAASVPSAAREFTEGSCAAPESAEGAGADAVPEIEIVSGAFAATASRV